MPFRKAGREPQIEDFDLDVLDWEPYFVGSWTEATENPKARVWSPHHFVALHLNGENIIPPNIRSMTELVSTAREQLRSTAHFIRALNGPRFLRDWAIVSTSEEQLAAHNFVLRATDLAMLRAGHFILWWPESIYEVFNRKSGRPSGTDPEKDVNHALAMQIYKLNRILKGIIKIAAPCPKGTSVEAQIKDLLEPELEVLSQLRPQHGKPAADPTEAVYREYRTDLGPPAARAFYREEMETPKPQDEKKRNRPVPPKIGLAWQAEGAKIGKQLITRTKLNLRIVPRVAVELRILQALLLAYRVVRSFQTSVIPATKPDPDAEAIADRNAFLIKDELTSSQMIDLIEIARAFNLDVLEFFPNAGYLKGLVDAARAIGIHDREREFRFETTMQFYGIEGLLYLPGDACLDTEVVSLRRRLRKGIPREAFRMTRDFVPPGMLMREDELRIRAGGPNWSFSQPVVRWSTTMQIKLPNE